MNGRPDNDVITGDNIIGRVVFNSMTVGRVMSFVQANMLFIATMAALLIALAVTLKIHFAHRKKVPKKVEDLPHTTLV